MKGTRVILHISAVSSALTSVDFLFIFCGSDFVLRLQCKYAVGGVYKLKFCYIPVKFKPMGFPFPT